MKVDACFTRLRLTLENNSKIKDIKIFEKDLGASGAVLVDNGIQIIYGNRIVLNVEEWINKSSGRGTFKLKIIDKNGNDGQVVNSTFIGFGTKPYNQIFQELFPWAFITIIIKIMIA